MERLGVLVERLVGLVGLVELELGLLVEVASLEPGAHLAVPLVVQPELEQLEQLVVEEPLEQLLEHGGAQVVQARDWALV